MVQFTKLRLSGFKSFVDPAEMLIAPGVTGVVGPNGCGKSNLVEALRWVMGETSAKQMRGGEMDDVIFGGSAGRPPRNLAEVTLVLDNAGRTAPPPFDTLEEIEVTRRIERRGGSLYKVNGREVRARDVHLLFADIATGARSPAMVSQGRVGAVIAAKPSERRGLLEEAAGIGGLYARRHEAENRLRAAEANLARLDDVVATLDEQLQALRRQARQATRYRGLSEKIREHEAALLRLRWLTALAAIEDARERRRLAEGQVTDLTAAAAAAATAQTEAAASLPALRQADAEAAAARQRLLIEGERLDAEQANAAAARREAELRLRQADDDLGREAARGADAEQALARLAGERAAVEAAAKGEVEALSLAEARLAEAGSTAESLDAELQRLTAETAAREAARQAAARRVGEAEARCRRLAERARETAAQRRRAEAESVAEDLVAEAEARLETALEGIETARLAVERGEDERRRAEAVAGGAREAVQAEAATRARLGAERQALAEILAEPAGGQAPVIDAVTVMPGREAALAAALGDDLAAPVDDAAPVRWQALPALAAPPSLPAGVEALSRFVDAPPALARRLSQIGVVADAGLGAALRHDLRPGQRLVSLDGDMWRWDGFTLAAGAPTAAATRLRQRNRLVELEERLGEAELRLCAAEERLEALLAAVHTAADAERRAREIVRTAEAAAHQARAEHARLAQQAAAAAARLAALDEAAARLAVDIGEAEAEEVEARGALAGLSDGGDRPARLAALRVDMAERRAAVVAARGELDRLTRDAAERRRRLAAIAGEIESWNRRAEAVVRHRAELAERRAASQTELERLSALPQALEARRAALLDAVAAAEARRAGTAEALAEAEQRLTEAAARLRAAEQTLAAAREDRVRRDAIVEAADQECRTVAQRIAERLDTTPERLVAADGAAEQADPDELQRRLDRLCREREAMGPVNLRAEAEAVELGARIEALKGERQDLTAAIAKLRHAIAEINREGRGRLLASFQEVDRHFRDLFVRLFGGGRAHLALTESDDPLLAGLEIMASPPGKRLQTMSLLSGGEQALTALALLFAVFLTNPAPICVLDEVDAPLDDANVDRFCALVEEIAHGSATRFLVVTHHRMTMARMDRLFGVTMAERGISRLVSVDLRQAEGLRDTG